MTKSYNSLYTAYNDITEYERLKKRDRIIYVIMGGFLGVVFVIGLL